MDKRWILLIDNYSGVEKNAVNMLSGVIAGYLNYVLPVKFLSETDSEELSDNNIIVVGNVSSNKVLSECNKKGLLDVPEKEEAYSIYVGESTFNEDAQMILIAGYDEKGILYGCMDLCYKYFGDIVNKNSNLWKTGLFDRPLDRKLNGWKTSASPAIKTRALWTWGHVIYDYRNYLSNMARLRLNEVVIWNDRMPINAKDVVDYAHSLGIKVIWGFSWGWGTLCEKILNDYNEQNLLKIKDIVFDTFENECADTGCDGIYFQSFTELVIDYIKGRYVADMVTELVNCIAGALLEKYPALHIQFGLHATSVKNHLEFLKNVDKRVHIVWEDCGSFPYDYWPENVENFEETYAFNNKLLTLRGEDEKFGAVLKGMLKLDWTRFEHFNDSYVLGERTNTFMEERLMKKNKVWKYIQGDWLNNTEYARKIISQIAEKTDDCIIEALVEDAMFEKQIAFPVAVFAELLWNPEKSSNEIISTVSKYPCVTFANI